MRVGVQLADPRLLDSAEEFGDDITVQILSVFPNFVVQQIHNSVALRLVLPKGPNETELQWIYALGFEDDDEAMTERRLLQSNLVGPAGYVSMEDGAVGGFVQRAIVGGEDECSGHRDGRVRPCLGQYPHDRSLDPRLLARVPPADGVLKGAQQIPPRRRPGPMLQPLEKRSHGSRPSPG